jgi:multidrug efflux pump subunit AcrA (membrane-fusion protein)
MRTQALIETPKPVEAEIPVPPPTRRPPRIRVFRVLTFGIVGGVVVGLLIWTLPNLIQKPPANVIEASGRIEGRDVTLAAKEIQGRVKNLHVDEG